MSHSHHRRHIGLPLNLVESAILCSGPVGKLHKVTFLIDRWDEQDEV